MPALSLNVVPANGASNHCASQLRLAEVVQQAGVRCLPFLRIRAELEQQLDEAFKGPVAGIRDLVQGRPFTLVLGIRICTGLEQELSGLMPGQGSMRAA